MDSGGAPFRKVLIANRGEIAVRIARGLRDLGIASVAVFSEADRGALHVRSCDEAYGIGPAPARESYLDIERVLAAARQAGADAVHPGYGFLAEDAGFARAVSEAGLVWIGPPASAMELMGDKVSARRAAMAAAVPVVPGSDPLTSEAEAAAEARRIGFPLLVKAAAGGGGKGMRAVRSPEELHGAVRAARSEGAASFGDDTIYMERLIEDPHHVEIQILADAHGNVIHLGERECSVQRRHQKVVEESPSPFIGDELRNAMGETAIRVARAAGYVNAGTCEFLVGRDHSFFFLEMNTRLQVEHPVTEMVLGVDLVSEQLRIAAGLELSKEVREARPRGHAIEARIYAEDASRGFLPSPGTVTALREPQGPGVRVDSGIVAGSAVPVDYDPILAKLIVWGQDRPQALRRLRRALQEYRVSGVVTNLDLHRRIADEPRFVEGLYDTGVLGSMDLRRSEPTEEEIRVAALAAALYHAREVEQSRRQRAADTARGPSLWRRTLRSGGSW